MNYSPSFIHEFLRRLEGNTTSANEFPAYRANDASDRQLLATCSQPQSFLLGTGASIFTNCLIPAIVSARSEVIFVTCFWARSKTLTALHDALVKLAAHRRALIRDAPSSGAASLPPLRIRICMSSMRLLHPQSRNGYLYPPSSWEKRLGLPEPGLLEAAEVQLQVKSLFFLPLSVMHPKFVIVDRQRAFLPSCNVSWESWLEGCVEITGDAVRSLVSFYSRTWGDTMLDPEQQLVERAVHEDMSQNAADLAGLTFIQSTAHYRTTPLRGTLPTLVLPSPHHRNPRFRPFPWQKAPAPPATPLNTVLLQLFEQAERSIYIQTPNLTCEPVIASLLDALARGVNVTIVTNRNMMLLEQLVTAGTTTAWCIRSLMRRFHRMKAAAEARTNLEAGPPTITGRLRISYFRAKSTGASPSDAEEPVHSHLKLTLVDAAYVVLGSGNMDRASWFTSQELGTLFHDRDFCARVKAGVDHVLEGRLDPVFDSGDEVYVGT
ncbi:hypothetical protein C8A03DRAFT_14067 [Achaetomium macrosporum]|uniref:PLD phosphodiesterase domain-containing protein n=1 Tax=Achaetomium macrosporum TaxID=79813 RepID=A0AAN7CCJ0_9PEZI|nr:hypothetical protein C8A03DRAFT_14067 [Achaetomium macrosporum]